MQFANIGAATGPRGEPVGSEDCLTLDVYAPPVPPEQVPAARKKKKAKKKKTRQQPKPYQDADFNLV